MAEYERLCAVISSIKDILESEYQEMPGWEPNYLKLHSRVKASRFNLIGTIIDINVEYPFALTIDDGTGQIEVRSFDDLQVVPSIGETVLIVGKPRKYNEKMFLNSELVKIIDNPGWINHRKKQIELLKKHYSKLPLLEENNSNMIKEESSTNSEDIKTDLKNSKEEVPPEITDSEKIYNMINDLDKGDGAQVSIILEKCEKLGIMNVEKSIQLMLEMGDIFEIKSGRVKIL